MSSGWDTPLGQEGPYCCHEFFWDGKDEQVSGSGDGDVEHSAFFALLFRGCAVAPSVKRSASFSRTQTTSATGSGVPALCPSPRTSRPYSSWRHSVRWKISVRSLGVPVKCSQATAPPSVMTQNAVFPRSKSAIR